MSENTNSRRSSLTTTRVALAERLRARRSELGGAIFAHISDGMSNSQPGADDPEYMAGMQAAILAVLDYGLTGIELGENWSGPIPTAAVEQAHRAARSHVSLDTVLLRYTAGHALLSDFVLAEADHFSSQAIRQVLGNRGLLLEHVMVAVADEYKAEVERMGRSPEQHRMELVQRLLAGAPIDSAELGYELDAWHIGVIATGARAPVVVRGLAARLDRRLLTVSRGEGALWAWLGGQQRVAVAEIERVLSAEVPTGVSLTIGEPGAGGDGWRLTHLQAQAALRVALRRPQRLTRFADVALLASVLGEETMARSFDSVYLAPLDGETDGGAASRKTLRAYFAAGHSIKASAAALGVDRNTVRNRLDRIEQRLGYPIHKHRAELDVALRLQRLHDVPAGANDTRADATAEID